MSTNAILLAGEPAEAALAGDARARRGRWSLGDYGLLTRLERAIYHRLQADRTSDVGAFIAANGGMLTDDLEREISRRFGNLAGK
jgi:hypothetical protein